MKAREGSARGSGAEGRGLEGEGWVLEEGKALAEEGTGWEKVEVARVWEGVEVGRGLGEEGRAQAAAARAEGAAARAWMEERWGRAASKMVARARKASKVMPDSTKLCHHILTACKCSPTLSSPPPPLPNPNPSLQAKHPFSPWWWRRHGRRRRQRLWVFPLHCELRQV